MNKVKVTVVNEHTLKLEQDAKKDDLIDLREVVNVDTTLILERIKEAKDQEYLKELAKVKESLEQTHKLNINEVKNALTLENANLKQQLNTIKDSTTKDLELKYLTEINNLKSQVELTKRDKDLEYTNKLNEKDTKLEKLNLQNQQQLLLITNEHKEKIRGLEDEIANLKRERSSLNVKRIGENLEIWADNEYQNQALAGLPNVTWEKDNEVIKNSKADFIYKVYANENKNKNELLTSAILEMKSEDPLAANKQSIEKFTKKLDQDRINKNIEYAILVSEIGMDVSNDVPIRKVAEYEKMYIVRPEYFLTILNIITAFGMNYKELLIAKEEQRIKFKDYEDILVEFENMKNEILDNSVNHINTQLSEILKQSETISKANEKILRAAELALNTHLKTVINKLENFKITKLSNQIKNI